MHVKLRTLFWVIGGLCTAGMTQAAQPLTVAPPSCAAVTPQTCSTVKALGRGVNFGNMLEAPREGDWGVRVEPAYMDLAAANFSTVRLPVRWSNHAAPTADATIDETFARRVDEVVDALLAKGLYVILDLHHYNQLTGSALHPNEKEVDPAVVDTRLLNIWRQVAQRYADRSPRLLFELVNEPNTRLTAQAWNALAPRVLAAVRATNPTRAVLIGPVEWNSVQELKNLRVPPDRNLIVAIHNYDPFDFTHQGVAHLAMPRPTGKSCCDASQRRSIADAMETARRWSMATGYPLHLGEFGSYEKADLPSRAAYTHTVRDEAERRGIPWTFWELASEFGMWSPQTGEWIEPLRKALLD